MSNFLGNLIWLIFGGLLSGLGYILGGFLLCVTIVGFPFGIQAIKLGIATLAPFGKNLETSKSAGLIKLFFDTIWFLFFGWEIALAHLIFGSILFITIIGIPFAYQHFKLILVALFPFSYKLE